MPKKTPPETWAMVRAEYLAGTPLGELESKYGVRKQSICRQARNGLWGAHGSMAGDVAAAAAQGVKDRMTATFTERAEAALERHLGTCEGLSALLAAEVQAVKDAAATRKAPPGAYAKTIRTMAQALRDLVAVGRDVKDAAEPLEQKPKTDFDRFQELVALAAEAENREKALDVLTGGESESAPEGAEQPQEPTPSAQPPRHPRTFF